MTGRTESALASDLARLLRTVGDQILLPHFGRLGDEAIFSKATPNDPTDVVTIADREAEAFLGDHLRALVPGTDVLGEEAASADSGLFDLLKRDAPVWVIDPLDGTRNYAAGKGPFGTMVALVERRVVLAGAIFMPVTGDLITAERGLGVFHNGEPLTAPPETGTPLRGTLNTRFLAPDIAAALEANASSIERVPSVLCAAHQYTELALGRVDFALYYRLLPWDHAPGSLIVRELGGVMRHPNGREYSITDEPEPTLLATSKLRYRRALKLLFPDASPESNDGLTPSSGATATGSNS
jgi:fructose-1,6-bisphosphatase/inositol monophosphatase family enzyme